MSNDSKKVSELGITTTISANDRILVLTNPSSTPVTQTITLSNFVANSMPKANSTAFGVVKVGNTLSVNATGFLNVPIANTSLAGIIKVGENLSVNATGFLNANSGQPEGVYSLSYVTNVNNYVVSTEDVILFVDPNSVSQNVTIVLPTANVAIGQEFLIKNINPGANYKVIVITDAGVSSNSNYVEDPVTGAYIVSYDLYGKGESHTWIWDGTVYKHLAELNDAPIFYASVDAFHEVAIVNPSSSNNASADWVAYNNIADFEEGTGPYIDMGINSSTYANANYSINGPSDGYLYNTGGDLTVGTQDANTNLILHAGGTTNTVAQWKFNSNGYTTFPNNNIRTTINNSLLISTSNTVSNNQWTFSSDGSTTLPGSLNLPVGNIIEQDASIEVIVDNLILDVTVDYSTGEGDNLAIGDYGLTRGIAHPWIVYRFTTIPTPALVLDDVIAGEGIPLGSTVIFVGTGANNKIVITNVAQPDLTPAVNGTVVSIVRPIVSASLTVTTPANTDISLNTGNNGYIINHSSIIPFETSQYDLGTPLRRFRTLWLGGSSIYVVDETLGVDQSITARDGNLVIAGGAGLKVGEFTFNQNNILLANTERDINIGTTGATGHINFNRTINVKNATDEWNMLSIDQEGRVTILSEIAEDPTQAAMSIVGARTRDIQPPNNLGVQLQLTGSSTSPSRIYHDSYGTGNYSAFIGRHARGNSLSPTQSKAGDIISRIGANPYDLNSFSSISTTRIDMVNQEDQTDTNKGGELQLWTTAIGSNTIAKRLTVNENGIKFNGGGYQNTAFNANNAVTKINVGVGLTQSGNVGVVGIDSTAVLSITGTANQVSVANVGGNYTLSLPQNIGVNSTVQFQTLTVANLTVTGTTTSAAELSITDKVIHLAATSTAVDQIDGGGFTLGNTAAAYHVSFLYDLVNDRWDTNGAGLKTLDLLANTINGDTGYFDGVLHAGNAYEDIDFNNAIIQADGNVNSYIQNIIKNHSNGTDASADVIATNDLGDDTNYYIDMGINSSTYSNSDYSISGPNGGYLYNLGGDLAVGTATASKVIKLFTGGSTSDKLRVTVTDLGMNVVGNVSATTFIGNLNGTANNTNFVGSTSAANVVSNSQLYTVLGNYQTTAGLSANVATLTSNNTSFVGSTSAANVVSNNQLYTVLGNYQTTAGLSTNVATLTSNNTSFVGSTSAANVVSNSQLYTVLGSYALLSDASFTNNVSIANTLTVSKLSANGTLGSAGQLLTSNGTTTYWSTPASGGVSSITGANNIVLSGSIGAVTINRIDGSQTVVTNINTSTYNVLSTDQYVGSIRSATSTSTITLPLGSGLSPGRQYIIKDEGGFSGSSLRRVTVAASGSDLIDGSATRGITSNYGALTVLWTGTKWSVI